jgi:hypothetical protein
LLSRLGGSLQGSRIRQLHVDIEVALIFVRKKAGRDLSGENNARNRGDSEERHRQHTFLYKLGRPPRVTLGRSLKRAIEPAKHALQYSVTLFFRPKQESGEGRT